LEYIGNHYHQEVIMQTTSLSLICKTVKIELCKPKGKTISQQ